MNKSDIRKGEVANAVTGTLFATVQAGQGSAFPPDAAELELVARRKKLAAKRVAREDDDQTAASIESEDPNAESDMLVAPGFENSDSSPFALAQPEELPRFAQASADTLTDAPAATGGFQASEAEAADPGAGSDFSFERTAVRVALGGAVIAGAAAAGGGGGGGGGGSNIVAASYPQVLGVVITGADGLQNSTLNAGDVIYVTVTIDEVVTVSGLPTLALNIGGTTVRANYASGSGTTELVFTYTIQAGQTDADGISVVENSLLTDPPNNIWIRDAAPYDLIRTHSAVADDANFMVDTTAPAQTVTITAVTDNIDPIRGTVASGGGTNDTAPDLAGTLSASIGSGEVVAVYRDGTKLGTATVNGTAWTYADTGLADGNTYAYTARVEDAAGNLGVASGAYTISVVVTGPKVALAITAIADNTGAPGDWITSDTRLTVSGTHGPLNAGEKVQISTDDGVTWHDATTVTSTTWSYTDPALHATNFTYQARLVDSISNVGTSAQQAITIDTQAPGAPTISRVIDDVLPITTDVPLNGRTNDTAPGVVVTLGTGALPGDTLQLYNGITAIGSRVLTAGDIGNGSFTFTLSGLADATYTLTARVTDIAGNPSTASTQFVFTVDTTAAPPTLDLAAASDSGSSPTDNITNVTTPTFDVTGEVGATVTLFNDANGNGVVDVGDTTLGTVTLTTTTGSIPSSALLPGTYNNIKAIQTDTAGNTSAASAAHAPITIDTTAPTVISFEDNDADNQVAVNVVQTYTVTFSEDIDVTTVTAADFSNAGTATINIGAIAETTPGVFSVQVTPTSAGTLQLRIPVGAVITDVAGNPVNTTAAILDNDTLTVEATIPTVISFEDGDADNLVPVNVAQAYTVTFSEDIDVTTVAAADFSNAGTATINIGAIAETTSGVFSVAVTPTSAGTLQLRIPVGAVITDVAGNPVNTTAAILDNDTLNVDSGGPTLTVDIIDASLNDTDTSSAVTFTFTEAPVGFDGGDITLAGGALTGLLVTADPLVYSATFTATDGFAGTGSVTVGTGYTDAAGNPGTGGSDTVTIDRANPAVTVNIVDASLNDSDVSSDVTFTFTEVPVGFDAGDIGSVGGAVTGLVVTGDPLIYTATFTATDGFPATGLVAVGTTGYTDAAGNVGTTGTDTVAIDRANPTCTILDNVAPPDPATGPVVFTFQFSEAVTGFDDSDVVVDVGTKGTLSTADNITFTMTITPPVGGGNMTVEIDHLTGGIVDGVGNALLDVNANIQPYVVIGP